MSAVSECVGRSPSPPVPHIEPGGLMKNRRPMEDPSSENQATVPEVARQEINRDPRRRPLLKSPIELRVKRQFSHVFGTRTSGGRNGSFQRVRKATSIIRNAPQKWWSAARLAASARTSERFRLAQPADFVKVKQCAKTRWSQVQHQMQKLIGRTEDQRFLSIGQTARHSTVKKLVDGDAEGFVTEPEMQLDSRPGRMRKLNVMAVALWHLLSADPGYSRLLSEPDKRFPDRPRSQPDPDPEKASGETRGIVSPGEQGTLQSNRWECLQRREGPGGIPHARASDHGVSSSRSKSGRTRRALPGRRANEQRMPPAEQRRSGRRFP